ncbi:MAG: DUF3039 domain-containing protein [Nitriliruptorales bacterium]|nr:DUF3039 domain-containing protein [Nitriliruptorales bacterium]
MSEILEQPRIDEVDASDRERFAHIIAHPERGRAAALITEAQVTGTPVEALCGKKWVPSRDPKRFPICPECKEIKQRLLDRSG